MFPDSNHSNQKSIFRKAWDLYKKYLIDSDERYQAWLLLICTLVVILSMVGLQVLFAWSMNGFWNAISSKSWALFGESISIYCGLLLVHALAGTIKDYLLGVLYANWKASLTQYFSDENFKEDNYLRLKREKLGTEVPVSIDVDTFVKTTLYKGSDFLNTIFKLISFIGTLWMVGGGISFVLGGFGIFIPGYLIWIAIIFAISGTYISDKIANPISVLNKNTTVLESSLLIERNVVEQQAENIALERGGRYHSLSEKNKITRIKENVLDSILIRVLLERFQFLYSSVAGISPYIAAAPLYFSGQIKMGELMQIGYAFGEVFDSFNWFSENYIGVLNYRDAINRLSTLDYHLNNSNLLNPQKITFIQNPQGSENINIKNLTLGYENPKREIFNNVTITLKKGEHTVIQGASGSGKSTLLKVIAQTHQSGSGQVSLPQANKMCFLAQSPVLFKNRLKAMLAYPDSEKAHSDVDYCKVLRQVQLLEFITYLTDDSNNEAWFDNTSLGQKQKIALARALLQRPEWLFLDEATASIDEPTEEVLYQRIKEEIPDITIVSIAHKPSVANYHTRTLFYRNGCFGPPPRQLPISDQPQPSQEEVTLNSRAI